MNSGRRSGLTFAPEGGSWRLRKVINKLILEEDLYGAVESAFSQGWTRMKLYFLTGLPTETDEDTLGIVELAQELCGDRQEVHQPGVGHRQPRRLRAQAAHPVPVVRSEHRTTSCAARSASSATPPRRPRACRSSGTTPTPAVAEGIATRGDRRIGAVIERVWRHGGLFQEWGEHFDLRLWIGALDAEGLSLDWYVYRHREEDEILPWDHLTAGLHKDFLWGDWQDALAESGCRGLPVDPVLRLRCVHRLRHRARRRLADRTRRRQPGHRTGPRPVAARSRSR